MAIAAKPSLPSSGVDMVSRTTEMTTLMEEPQMNAKISSRGGSGSQRSNHR